MLSNNSGIGTPVKSESYVSQHPVLQAVVVVLLIRVQPPMLSRYRRLQLPE